MNARILMAGLFLAGCLVNAANADVFGNLKKAGDAVKKSVNGDQKDAGKDESGKASDKATAGSASSSGKHPPVSSAKDRKFPPGISFSTMLNGVKYLPQKAQIELNGIQATFLPEDGREGYTILRKADGKELYKIEWKSQQLKQPYFLLDVWKVTDLQSGKQVTTYWADLKEPGDYVLDFYTKAEHFYTFPFSVAKLSNDDPFSDGSFLVLNGDWADWAYLFYPEADPEKSLSWKVWLRVDKPVKEKDVKPRIEITRDADSKPVCVSRDITLSLRPEWVRYEFDMIFPNESNTAGAYFKAKDLLNTDGDYTLTVKLDDKLYGTWKFTIAGNKPQVRGRAERGKADPLTFIEGGRDAFWYCRVKDASAAK